MAYPYSSLPTPVTDATTATPNTHSGHHNSVHGALNDLLTELGTDPGGGTSVTSRLTTIETKTIPAGGTTDQVLAKTSGTDYAVSWQTASGGGAALHSALLATKVWSSTQYVWPGDGSAPDSSSFTNIVFIDPTGTHDPTTSTGGRTVTNDLWETGTTPAGVPAGGTAGQVLTKDTSTDFDTSWASPTGTYPKSVRATRTSGNISLTSTAVASVDTGMDLVIAAATNDVLMYGMNGQLDSVAQIVAFDVYTMVSGSPLHSFGAGLSASLATTIGVPGWAMYGPSTGTLIQQIGHPMQYVVVSGDIVSGNVTLRLRYAKTTSTARVLSAASDKPFQVWCMNLGPN